MRYEDVTGPLGDVVSVPADAEAWEIFADMDGAEGVAVKLTEALKKAAKAPSDAEAESIMYTALRTYRQFGAYDSEPSYLAERSLAKLRRSSRW